MINSYLCSNQLSSLREEARGKASGHGQDFYPFGPGLAQDTAAFVDRGAGGVDIIDEQDRRPGNPGRVRQGEGIGQVAAPLFAAQQRLRSGWPVSPEQVRHYPVPPLGQASPGNDQGLVESPGAQSAAVQGDGEEQIRLAKSGEKSFGGEQGSQCGKPVEIVGEFERQDQVRGRGAVVQQTARQVKGMATGKAVAAKVITAGDKGKAAAGTERGVEKAQFRGAMGAEQRRPGACQPLVAAQAMGGKQQILERFDQG